MRHCFASQAPSASEGRLAFDAEVNPGSSLNVALRSVPCDVAVAAGPLTSARVEAAWADGASGRLPLDVALEGSTVTVQLAKEDAKTWPVDKRGMRWMRVDAQTPPRFFSVTVETPGCA